MAEPTAAVVGATLAKVVEISQSQSDAARVASTGLLARLEATREALSGRVGSDAAPKIRELRAAAASVINGTAALGVVEPVLRQLALAYSLSSAQKGDIRQVMLDLYDQLLANSQHVKQRALVFGTPIAGAGNVGDGICLRLTVDENGQVLQGWFAGSLTLECVVDQLTGARRPFKEVFNLRGSTAESPDLLEREGYGPSINQPGIQVASAVLTEAQKKLLNPGLNKGRIVAPTITTLTAWQTVSGSWAAYEANEDATYIYLDSTNGQGTSRSLRQIADDTVYQELVSTARASLKRGRPVLVCWRVYKRDSCDGTLTPRLSGNATSGGKSRAITVSSGLSAGWNNVFFEVTPGTDSWPSNFNVNGLKLSLQLSGRTTGSLYYSDPIFVEWTRIGGRAGRVGRGAMGTYIAILSGQAPFMGQDSFSIADTEVEADRGKIAYWLASYDLGFLPSIEDATQITAAGGRTLTFADANPDTVTASTGDFDADGYKVGMTLVVAGTSSNNGSYKIATVTALVITLEAAEELTAEGPLSATATLDATAYFPDAS